MVSIINLKRIKVLFILIYSFILSLPALAQENVISSVVISNSKDIKGSYELNIDSTQVVPYRTTLKSDNSIYFDLKNSVLAENIGTYYDDVTNIDNVTVKQMDRNKVRIYVEGKNAKNTDLIFPNSVFETQENSKQLIINRPINEYRSTDINHDLENQEDIQDWNDNSFNFSHLTLSLFSYMKDGSLGIILVALAIFVMILLIVKAISQNLSNDNEPLIAPASLYSNQPIESLMEENNVNRDEMLKTAQQQLSVAHQKYQTYLKNKYQNNINKPNVNPIVQGIALNQYQKSSQNPYSNQEVIKIKREYPDLMNDRENTIIPRRPKIEQKVNFTSPYIQRKSQIRPINKDNKSQSTNMKFLESVTKIYEQSGRKDLADGLKNSITKVKQNI